MTDRQVKRELPCRCGECPRHITTRPATKSEVAAWWRHHYPHWTPEKRLVYAIEEYTHRYAQWVNWKGWRKPPEWVGGPVPRHQLRPERQPMTSAAVQRWRRELREGVRSGASSTVQ